MKRRAVILILAAAMLCAETGCSSTNNDTGKARGETKENMEDSTQGNGAVSDYSVNMDAYEAARQFANVKSIGTIGQAFPIPQETEDGDSISNYTNCIDEVKITKTFEGDQADWQDFVIQNLAITDQTITNEYSLIYITGTVMNTSDSDVEYYASNTGIYVRNGNLIEQADTGEPGYFDHSGKGKNAYKAVIRPGESFSYKIGYVLEDQLKDQELYINMTSDCTNSQQYILIPFQWEES